VNRAHVRQLRAHGHDRAPKQKFAAECQTRGVLSDASRRSALGRNGFRCSLHCHKIPGIAAGVSDFLWVEDCVCRGGCFRRNSLVSPQELEPQICARHALRRRMFRCQARSFAFRIWGIAYSCASELWCIAGLDGADVYLATTPVCGGGSTMTWSNIITAHNAGWRPQFRFAVHGYWSGVCEFCRSTHAGW
jgi:hypothetical protein